MPVPEERRDNVNIRLLEAHVESMAATIKDSQTPMEAIKGELERVKNTIKDKENNKEKYEKNINNSWWWEGKGGGSNRKEKYGNEGEWSGKVEWWGNENWNKK